jgi:hypothetical protein
MQSAAKHLAWRSNLYREQTSAREMLRCALHDPFLLLLPYSLRSAAPMRLLAAVFAAATAACIHAHDARGEGAEHLD